MLMIWCRSSALSEIVLLRQFCAESFPKISSLFQACTFTQLSTPNLHYYDSLSSHSLQIISFTTMVKCSIMFPSSSPGIYQPSLKNFPLPSFLSSIYSLTSCSILFHLASSCFFLLIPLPSIALYLSSSVRTAEDQQYCEQSDAQLRWTS